MSAVLNNCVLFLFTWTYAGPLYHGTRGPIEAIEKHQNDDNMVRGLLSDFRSRKERELHFVQRAATLSAAAVIGVKSWSDAAESFWLAQVSWHCSFFFSILALVSSSQERLLDRIPRVENTEASIDDALSMLLLPRKAGDEEQGRKEERRERSQWLMFLWQTPLMLMHYSWLTFLVGYELYLITPLIEHRHWSVQCTGAVISTIVGVLLVAQFRLNAITTKQALNHMGCRAKMSIKENLVVSSLDSSETAQN